MITLRNFLYTTLPFCLLSNTGKEKEAFVSSKEKIRDLCSQLLRAENPAVIQFVASQLQIAVAEFAIENAMSAELSLVLADLSTAVPANARDN